MPTKVEKDSLTGQETTGHEWDGIKELNTPLPKWWLYVFYASIIFSVIYMVLYPAIPSLSGYTEGLLGWDRRAELREEIQEANAAQAQFVDRIKASEPRQIAEDNELLNFAMAGGQAAFADNCAPCHGQGGAGRPGGYPTLADDAWIWGGTMEAVHHTIAYGVRNEHEQSRQSMMPAFGNILDRQQVEQVATYVYSLSNDVTDQAAVQAGQEIFQQNCVACHGANAQGNNQLGAPNLSDAIWLYGGEKADIVAQIAKPKHGNMPAWSTRLDPETVKMLAVYVHSLGGGQ
ncbi:cytochrome-c oxidase, cbb3-type subunit III [Ferruginivarius sediminum]|uniref:Cbb3-type cytochrome c oxidase subunit n=1 Tax=Ferruginivarius sediminum TaxID=2661937 RepID=A0A369T946_9PROT|nr:cytochrome-c oxidase, cbb3-type subunit III [Ferruginivarius sediminum]RDD61820.1 cytochrome-c oxidase, cbb3-type subunit III [Ferruginivarius sediminum]